MSMKEMRDLLYCHLMDLTADDPYNWDYDRMQVRSALQEAVDYFDREMEYIRNARAK